VAATWFIAMSSLPRWVEFATLAHFSSPVLPSLAAGLFPTPAWSGCYVLVACAAVVQVYATKKHMATFNAKQAERERAKIAKLEAKERKRVRASPLSRTRLWKHPPCLPHSWDHLASSMHRLCVHHPLAWSRVP
jgi:hypothetical protein